MSRTGVYKLMPLALRAIANRGLAAPGWREAIVGYDRHAESIGEMIHISALERLGVAVDGKNVYAPYSLRAMLDVMQSTYDKNCKTGSPIRIVGWDGSILDPDLADEASIAQKLIAVAKQKVST